MKIVIDATEPTLDIREAREDEEGFEVPDAMLSMLRIREAQVRKVERAIVEQVITAHPDHPDVLCLREYLKGQEHG